MPYRPLFFKGGVLYLLDQKALPSKVLYKPCRSASEVALAIKDMTIRGAPLIGQAAGWGLYLDCAKVDDEKKWPSVLKKTSAKLIASRPTGRNLRAQVEALTNLVGNNASTLKERKRKLLSYLIELENNWEKITDKIAFYGAQLIKPHSKVLTICNTGRLATLGQGTAFAIIAKAFKLGKIDHVYALETRPYLQGLRLTTWELKQAKIPHTVITDGMAAHLMSKVKISAFLAGCDRVAANGDTANKVGTFNTALICGHFNVPVYIACPKENIDAALLSGKDIPIEERSAQEVTHIAGVRLAPSGTKAWHPAFDVTPHHLITGLVTEEGVWDPNN